MKLSITKLNWLPRFPTQKTVGIFNNKFATPTKATIQFSKELTKTGVMQDLKADQFQFVLKDRFRKVQVTVTKTVGEKDNLLVAAVLLPLNMEFNNSFILLKPRTTPTPPTPPVTPKSAKPVVSSEKSGPQLPETNQTNDYCFAITRSGSSHGCSI